MKGLMWKRGYTFPTMKRVFCVLEGSMLSVYTSEHEYERGYAPHKVIEITQVQPWDGRSTFKNYEHGFILVALGGKTYQCSVDSAALQKEWTDAIQMSLEEPYRIVADEIIEAQKELNRDVNEEHNLADAAAEAVERAEIVSKAIKGGDERIQLLKDKQAVLRERLIFAKQDWDTAEAKAKFAFEKSATAKSAAHDDMMKNANEPSKVSEDLKREVAKLSAVYEIESNVSSTAEKQVHDLKLELDQIDAQLLQAVEALNSIKQDAQQTIQNATGAIHSAQTAKVKVKLRLASWTSSPSHVDSLAQGYLKVKNTIQPKMHRKYFVLFGKTLCWYKNADEYVHNMKEPLGVVHVAGPIKDWNGKVGLTTYPNAFSIPTVEGKELHCSASVGNEVTNWGSAILTGSTMIPMSPERAMDAKIRRDSFDLTSPPRHTHRSSFFSTEISSASADLAQSMSQPTPQANISPIIEGSLVKQGHFVPTMRRKYCVLIGIHIYFFDSHEHYVQNKVNGTVSPETSTVSFSEVSRVSDWDGQNLLVTYPHAFQIETVHHSHIHCSAASASEKERWVKGVRAAIAHHVAECKSVGETTTHVAAESQAPLTDHARAVLEFETILTEYFHQHNAAKHEDVYVLTKLFQGREGELLKHLDETYNTTLTNDHAALVAKLAKYHIAKLNDNSAIETDGLIPHLEGIMQYQVPSLLSTSYVKVYAILLGNKILHFTTRIAALTEPDHPSTSYSFSNVDGTGELSIVLIDTQGNKHVYSSNSAIERDHWIRTMHAGLEYARVHHERITLRVSESTTLEEVLEPIREDSPETVEFKQLIAAFYEQHNPEGLSNVEALLIHFHGKEHLLLESLDKIYGTQLTSDPNLIRLCSTIAEVDPNAAIGKIGSGSTWRTSITSDGKIPQHKKNGFVMVKCTPVIPKLRKCYCVIEDGKFTCYNGLNMETILVGPWPILNVSIGDGQFSYYIEGPEMKVFGQLSTEVEFHEWLSACHVAIATQHMTKLNDTPLAKHLTAFYAKVNPSKMDQVALLLDTFEGREIELLYKIDAVYHSSLATDPNVLALLPAANKELSSSGNDLLMEGYLMKKGYMMPSMTKFYGVLRGHVLHIYDTKEDSTTHSTAHHPKELTAVTEWNESTHDKFRYGLELVTANHRTYFVAFPSEDEKIHWTSAIQHGLASYRLELRKSDGSLLSETTRAVRDKIIHSYSHVSQHFVKEVDSVMELSHGFDIEILKILDKKYGTQMSLDDSIINMLDKSSPWKPHQAPIILSSADGRATQSLYGVLDDTKLNCFATRDGYVSGLMKPQITVNCLTISPWTDMGFVIDTDEGAPVYMMGDSPIQTTKWIEALRNAIDKATLSSLLHSFPTENDTVFSSFLTIEESNTMARRYAVIEEMEIKLYATPDALEPIVSYDLVSIESWINAPATQSNPFQLNCISTDKSHAIVLHCNADTKDLKDKWESHITEAMKQKIGNDLIQDQTKELEDGLQATTTFQEATLRGYMSYRKQSKRKFGDSHDGYFILHHDHLIGFQDEIAARSGSESKQILHVIVQSLFVLNDGTTSHARPIDFYIQAKLARDNSVTTLHFIPPDLNDRDIWATAINAALSESRGQILLEEQEAEYHLQSAIRKANDPRAGFVVSDSSMEGELQRVQEAFLRVDRDTERYCVLIRDTLTWFTSKSEAEDYNSNNTSNERRPEQGCKILSVSDWIIPYDTSASQTGFQVEVIITVGEPPVLVQFTAATVDLKEKWIRALKAAADEAVAEQALRDLLKRQATLKVQKSCELFQEGYMHLRRSHFAATWKEYYCVLKGPRLVVFETREEFVTKIPPSAKYEVVFVGEWHGAVSAGIKNVFRIETVEDGFMEVYVDEPVEKDRWMQTIQAAIGTLQATHLVTRDMALPSYQGATMEGYLTKHGGTIRHSLKRYCVLLRTVWIYFVTQEDALSGNDPLGTLQVLDVESNTTEGDVPEHSFLLLTSGAHDKLCVEAHTGAEKQLWIDAIKGELAAEDKLRGDLRAAEEKERSKTLQLQETIQKARAINDEAAALDAETAATLKQLERFNSSNDDDDDDDDDEATPYIEFVDGAIDHDAPEDSPKRRASKNRLQQVLKIEKEPTPFWFSWCKCFSRPPMDSLKLSHDARLTEHERRLYSCEYYSNGTVDSSL